MIPVARKRVASSTSIPAPVGGLNARDSIANMPPTDAVSMDNWFPNTSYVSVRNGSKTWATGLPSYVESLCAYNGSTGSKLFACSGGGIYDVTAGGAVGAPVVTGNTSNRFQHTNMGNAAGQWLIMANGADPVRNFDGTTWTASAITGVSPSLLNTPLAYKNRLFFIENNSFRFWYLPLLAVQGAATSFDLSSLFKLGGYLQSIFDWTIDNATGIQSYFVAVSSQGEIVTYQGNDPSTVGSWAIAGHFRIGRPIGKKSFCKIGSDIALICADGLYPISKALLTDRSQRQDALSDKIVNLVTTDVSNYANNFGWQAILYPIGNKVIINVPQVENKVSYQYVMNSITGAWCRFTGWNASCWELLNDNIYYGTQGKVVRADYGTSDDSASITADCQQAFSYFGDAGSNKRFTMARPILQSNGQITPTLIINTNFETGAPLSLLSFSVTTFSPWNVSPWNTSPWSQGNQTRSDWQSVAAIGFSGAAHVGLSVKGAYANWQSTDILYEAGGVL